MAGDSEALRGASGDPGKAGGVKLNPVAASSSDMVDWAAYFRTYCELPRRQRQVMDLLLEGSDTKTI
ncbi:MAG: hypothetical protein ABI614_05130, partial [Planctomycetota bacterium]